MIDKYKNLPLRSGVGIVVLNKENKVFVAKRIDNKKNFWQMPQGGVDKGEDLYEAAIRELNEETSIKSVTLIKKIDNLLTYHLPDELLGIIWKGKYKGQVQQWYIMRFVGDENVFVHALIIEDGGGWQRVCCHLVTISHTTRIVCQHLCKMPTCPTLLILC